MGSNQDRASSTEPVFVHSSVHPHPVSRFIQLYVAAIDLKRTRVNFVAGTEDPKGSRDNAARGLVPTTDHSKLLAVFNGGFQPEHGGWGMFFDDQQLVAPKPNGCTVGIKADGTVEISTWSNRDPASPQLLAYRQAPPCLVENGQVNPALDKDPRPWAGQNPKLVTRRRSAVGLDATGRTLFYAMSEEADARLLAEGMRAIGAVTAAQLDINYSWTKFLLFGERDGKLRVTSTLVPKMVHRSRGYVEEPEPRDFYYITQRE